MSQAIRLAFALALTTCVAAAVLAGVNHLTAATIAGQGDEAFLSAVRAILDAKKEAGEKPFEVWQVREKTPDGVAELERKGENEPLLYAAEGEAVGYNKSSPIRLVAVFTNPGQPAAPLLEGYDMLFQLPQDAAGLRLVGFKTIRCEETPGLGDQIASSAPVNTWAGRVSGHPDDSSPDRTTSFQRQFRGRRVEDMALKKDGGPVEAITGATITTRAVVAALGDASDKIKRHRDEQPALPSSGLESFGF